MAEKKKSNARAAVYDRVVAAHPGMVRKGAANPYTAVNGNMYTLLHQGERLAIRLSERDREKFLEKYKTRLFEAYGAVMQEYVAVPDALFDKPKELEKWFSISFRYAKELKPRATKKK